MNYLLKFTLCTVMAFSLMGTVGCSDNKEATQQQSKPIAKEEAKEVTQESIQDASDAKFKSIVESQTKGYSKEDRERKKIEAQKKYEELQKKEAEEEAQRKLAN